MIRLQSLCLRRGALVLFEDANLDIFPGQHLVVTGANGTGKSSLFAAIQGKLDIDAGELSIPKEWSISHMAQEVEASDRSAIDYVLDGFNEYRTLQKKIATAEQDDPESLPKLYEEFEIIGGYQATAKAEQLLVGLGFKQEQLNTPVSAFSGGWRIRLNLAQALLKPSELMLLDEPTNHLDLDATLWLQGFLNQYPGTLLLISHDRDFIDSIADSVLHFEHQSLTLYKGNYTQFERQRAAKLEQQQIAFEKQQAQKAHLESFIRRFKAKASKAKQAQSRVKQLEKMKELSPAHVASPFQFQIPSSDKISDPLLTLKETHLGYGDKIILSGVNFSLHPGQAIGLLGANGAGKSTLIKLLAGDLAANHGELVWGENTKVGYFAQHQLEALDLDASPVVQLLRMHPNMTEQEARNFLGGFGFHGDKALEVCQGFSGGELARLALALMCSEKPNLILLDEPTNHLDIEMRQALAYALQSFEGAMVIVSHDRYLLESTVDEFWLVQAGNVTDFDGDLDDYARLIMQKQKPTPASTEQASPGQSVKVDRKEQKRLEAELRKKLSPLKKKVDGAEQSMEKLERALADIEHKLTDNSLYEADNKDQLQTLLDEQRAVKAELEDQEAEWLEAQEALEIAMQKQSVN